jgi:uncharacterized protein (TIGR02145 family)
MKKVLFSIVIFFYTLQVNAQDYLISFTGTGASNIVNTVKVDNLTEGTTLTLNGNDILRLTGTVGIFSFKEDQNFNIKIYPNPTKGISFLEFFPPSEGETTISVFDITGKQLFQTQRYFEKSRQELRLDGIRNGIYLITAKSNNYKISGKLLCTGESSGIMSIEEVSSNLQAVDEKTPGIEMKGVQSTVDMEYATGDRLKFTGISNIYSTVIVDVPTENKTIAFNFIACTDGDGNNYPVVKIGQQTWMAENVKTTNYNDVTTIPNVTDRSSWSSLTSPAYCWYDNNPDNKIIYGALYNWYTVNTGKLCPLGWHHPSSAEWTTLITSLGGASVAGSHLKETGTTHWTTPNNADNSSGFTALPAGVRKDTYIPWYDFGLFDLFNTATWFTSSNEASVTFAYWLDLSNGSEWATLQNSSLKNTGFSVRCLKDQ